MFEMKEN